MARPASDRRLRWLPRIVRAVIGVVVLIVGAGVAILLVATKPTLERSAPTERARIVRAVEVERRPVARVWRGHGVARTRDAANVAAEVAGQVVLRPDGIEAGARVEAGDVLVRLDASDYEDRLEQAQQAVAALTAQLDQLEAEESQISEQIVQTQEQIDVTEEELRRWREAEMAGAASTIEQLRLRGDLARLREALAALTGQLNQLPARQERIEADIAARRNEALTAQRNVERTRITAPINGYLQAVEVDDGDFVPAGGPVARIVSLGRLEIPVRIGASAFGRIRIGDEVVLHTPGPGDETWTGRIVRIAPEVDETRTLTVFVEVEQPEEWSLAASKNNLADQVQLHETSTLTATPPLLPGRFVVAWIESAVPERLFLVPRFAVRDDRVMVAVTQANAAPETPEAGRRDRTPRVMARQVEVLFHVEGEYPALDPTVREWAAIDGGLEEGDTVITSNLDELEPGAAVAIRSAGTVDGPNGATARDGSEAGDAAARVRQPSSEERGSGG